MLETTQQQLSQLKFVAQTTRQLLPNCDIVDSSALIPHQPHYLTSANVGKQQRARVKAQMQRVIVSFTHILGDGKCIMLFSPLQLTKRAVIVNTFGAGMDCR